MSRLYPWIAALAFTVAIGLFWPIQAEGQTIESGCKDCIRSLGCSTCHWCCNPDQCDEDFPNHTDVRSNIAECQAYSWGCSGTDCDVAEPEGTLDGGFNSSPTHDNSGAPCDVEL